MYQMFNRQVTFEASCEIQLNKKCFPKMELAQIKVEVSSAVPDIDIEFSSVELNKQFFP